MIKKNKKKERNLDQSFFRKCGKKGGKKVSKAKKLAAIKNGKKGGRPKKEKQ